MQDPKIRERMDSGKMEWTDEEYARLKAQQDRYDEGVALAEQLAKLSNHIGGDNAALRGFLDGLNREHRTLQQATFGVFLTWAYRLADLKEGWYDLRNEASVKVAKRIKELLGRDGNLLPFI